MAAVENLGQMMGRPKVFGIGMPKTATSSLARALTYLGYSVTGPDGTFDRRIARDVHRVTRHLAERFDAFQDEPWPYVYREMDSRYPDAKFVLTWREPEKWIKSQVSHFGTRTNPTREWVFGTGRGCPAGNEDHYLAVYNDHNREVQDYFADRPEKLLVVNFEAGDGWEKLCGFLGLEVPTVQFPHANSVGERQANVWLLHRLRQARMRARYGVMKARIPRDGR